MLNSSITGAVFYIARCPKLDDKGTMDGERRGILAISNSMRWVSGHLLHLCFHCYETT